MTILTPGTSTASILAQTGIIGENGYKDIIKDKITEKSSEQLLNRETKSAERRIHQAIDQSLNYLASLGLTDY